MTASATLSDPYVVPPLPAAVGGILETEIFVAYTAVDIGIKTGTPPVTLLANAQAFNGAIPGPLIKLTKGDTVVIRLRNNLPVPPAAPLPVPFTSETGIHWHGIELCSYSDGQPFTQNQTVPDPGGAIPLGRSTYLYKFKVGLRTGLYWYHPHHHSSMNQVFKGLYGLMVITDPDEESLVRTAAFPSRPLPTAAQTIPLVLSDVTVCRNPPPVPAGGEANPTTNYPTVSQPPPTPVFLCVRQADGGGALDEMGVNRSTSFGLGEIPNVQRPTGARTNEGNIVLTNGVYVGGRAGTPIMPGALDSGAKVLKVRRGQGLRLQIVNSATVRHFCLQLTDHSGAPQNLVRVGGEGGVLDRARLEGGNIPSTDGTGTFNSGFPLGEILLPPGSRVDVVIAIPDTAPAGFWTLWTHDFPRTGGGNANTATVPVMHLEVDVMLAVESPVYTITGGTGLTDGTPLRASIAGASVPDIRTVAAIGPLDSATFVPPKPGPTFPTPPSTTTFPLLPITLTRNLASQTAGVNAIVGLHDAVYPTAAHLDSARYVQLGAVVELSAFNDTGAYHPFHLHGFSMQPIRLTKTGSPTYLWNYAEYRDNVTIPPGYTLTFRIETTDRPLVDGVTMGGGLGRWMFHCHIFFHAHLGMLGEVVATTGPGPQLGREKPNVNVLGSVAYAPIPGTATRQGTFWHRDAAALPITLTSKIETSPGVFTPEVPLVPDLLPTATAVGHWTWTGSTAGLAPQQYVYITATDADGRKDQCVFRLVTALGNGHDDGDPHVTCVDGSYYDFQAVGEFTLLRDTEGFELQARQTPVPSATPIPDPNSGLTSCVSINTAIAARVGSHQLSYQPVPGRGPDTIQIYVDKKPVELSARGLDLDGARVSSRDLGDDHREIQIAYPNGTLVTITPWFWSSYNVWLLNVTVANTPADVGIMGRIPNGTWLPRLPNGATVGHKPTSLSERYVTQYRTFANAWRVTNATSLFVYAKGTSTATFTDVDWPAEKPPCKLKPPFKLPGAKPPLVNIDIATAEVIAKGITEKNLHRSAVFDIATTGDKAIVKAYRLLQALHSDGTAVHVYGDKPWSRPGRAAVFTAIVSGMTRKEPIPAGTVTFFVDGVAATESITLKKGRALFKTERLKKGKHAIRAVYKPDRKAGSYRDGTSANLLHTVGEPPTPPAPLPPPHRQVMRLPVVHGGDVHGGGTVPSFDAQASTFDARAGLPDDVRIAIADAIVDIGEVRHAGRLLEVGAGTGLVGEHLARNLPPVIPGGAPRYLGLDVSPPMLQAFVIRTKSDPAVSAMFRLADANGPWATDDQSIRVVYGARVFHLLKTEHLVAEVRRVGAPPFVTVVAGRIRRKPEGIFAHMRRALRRVMSARGHEPRRGDEHIETLVDAFVKIGGKRLEDRVVAKWSQPTSPARSLAGWRAKDGLGGLDLPAAEQASILREVEIWAANEYPDLDVEEPSEVEFVLHSVRLEVTGHDDPGGHHPPKGAVRRGQAKR